MYILEGSYSGGGGHIVTWRGCILQSGGSVFCNVEGVSRCILQSGGGLKVLGGVFYILQGNCYIHV